ncbi:MAG TPA: 2-hydroxyacid dehydrogenase [Mycobacteriales bacterium]|nr:2-hydroxyacid dehydrogenase [Mycobacteriales bacterium]
MTVAWVPHRKGLDLLGDMPPGMRVEVYDGEDGPPPSAASVEFVVPPFLGAAYRTDFLRQLPGLRVVQALTAGVDALLDAVPDTVTLCDARGVHDPSTAEWVVTAILAYLRDFPRFALAQARRQWDFTPTDALCGKTVLIVGYGSIGAAVERRLAGFEVSMLRAARRPRPGLSAVEDLPDLLPRADVVVLLVPMTPATRGLADAAFLARMKDGALLVNVARGPVVDTGALLRELESGRLRAALDVTDPEPLPQDHPLWRAPGLLLTPHVAGSTTLTLPRAYELVGAQLRRYAAGQPLANVVDRAVRY